ncbi:hypothetical protein GGU11DRAFT_758040 [Lentinula aff. detonsa]|nr:hypothetical protein GGU11DRAFT_758040 [Lentinula aff. detonsa]
MFQTHLSLRSGLGGGGGPTARNVPVILIFLMLWLLLLIESGYVVKRDLHWQSYIREDSVADNSGNVVARWIEKRTVQWLPTTKAALMKGNIQDFNHTTRGIIEGSTKSKIKHMAFCNWKIHRNRLSPSSVMRVDVYCRLTITVIVVTIVLSRGTSTMSTSSVSPRLLGTLTSVTLQSAMQQGKYDERITVIFLSWE